MRAADLGDAHTGELLLTPVKGRLADPQLAAELLDRGPRLGLTWRERNLLVAEPLALHGAADPIRVNVPEKLRTRRTGFREAGPRLGRNHAQLAGQQLQVLAAQQADHRLPLSTRLHPTPVPGRGPVCTSVMGALRPARAHLNHLGVSEDWRACRIVHKPVANPHDYVTCLRKA